MRKLFASGLRANEQYGNYTGKQIVTGTHALISGLSDKALTTFLTENKLIDLEEYKATGTMLINREAVAELLRANAESSGTQPYILDQIGVDATNQFLTELTLLPQSTRFESQFISSVLENTVDINVKGGSYIQMSSMGLKSITPKDKTKLVGEGQASQATQIAFDQYIIEGLERIAKTLETDSNYNVEAAKRKLHAEATLKFFNPKDTLKLIVDEKNGVNYAECRVSIKLFMDILPQRLRQPSKFAEAREWLLNWFKEQDLNSLIASYRVPTQAVSSMGALKPVDVLPEYMGDTVVVADAWTALNGSDFDVDKLFLLRYNYERYDATKEVEHPSEIYSKLNRKTSSGHVLLRGVYDQKGVEEAEQIGGIFSMRVKGSEHHFGNPFTSDHRIAMKDNLITVNSTEEAVISYISWVLNSEDDRAKWIRNEIISGKHKGKPIIYYKELGEPSHANALDYLINESNLSKGRSAVRKVPFEHSTEESPKVKQIREANAKIDQMRDEIRIIKDQLAILKDEDGNVHSDEYQALLHRRRELEAELQDRKKRDPWLAQLEIDIKNNSVEATQNLLIEFMLSSLSANNNISNTKQPFDMPMSAAKNALKVLGVDSDPKPAPGLSLGGINQYVETRSDFIAGKTGVPKFALATSFHGLAQHLNLSLNGRKMYTVESAESKKTGAHTHSNLYNAAGMRELGIQTSDDNMSIAD
jgi:hypothetical protein